MSVAGIIETSLYLASRLDQELFALDIGKVREVLGFDAVTRVLRTRFLILLDIDDVFTAEEVDRVGGAASEGTA